MSRVLTKHFWVINLLFITATTWLIVQSTVAIIKDRLIVYPNPGLTKNAEMPLGNKPEPYERYAPILERNVFNPAEKGLKLLPMGEEKPAVNGIREGSGVAGPSPTGTYRVMGTIIGPGANSFAVIQEGPDVKQQRIYRLQDSIAGGKITRISRNGVTVFRLGKEEVLPFWEEEVQPRSTADSSSPSGEVVKKLSANRFLLNREDVSAAFGNVNQLMTQARFRPNFAMGRPNGFSISEIQPGSLMEKIGLQNNDLLKKVNGQMINKPEDVFQVYSQLQKDSSIEIEIERNGQAEVLQYEIR